MRVRGLRGSLMRELRERMAVRAAAAEEEGFWRTGESIRIVSDGRSTFAHLPAPSDDAGALVGLLSTSSTSSSSLTDPRSPKSDSASSSRCTPDSAYDRRPVRPLPPVDGARDESAPSFPPRSTNSPRMVGAGGDRPVLMCGGSTVQMVDQSTGPSRGWGVGGMEGSSGVASSGWGVEVMGGVCAGVLIASSAVAPVSASTGIFCAAKSGESSENGSWTEEAGVDFSSSPDVRGPPVDVDEATDCAPGASTGEGESVARAGETGGEDEGAMCEVKNGWFWIRSIPLPLAGSPPSRSLGSTTYLEQVSARRQTANAKRQGAPATFR